MTRWGSFVKQTEALSTQGWLPVASPASFGAAPVVVDDYDNVEAGYIAADLAAADEHTVVIAIQQRNLRYLEALLLNVSSPGHAQYGEYLSHGEIGALVANPESVSAVTSWLLESWPAARLVNSTEFGEYLTVSAPRQTIDEMFDAQLRPYASPLNSSLLLLRSQSYSLPAVLAPSIAAVFNLVDFPPLLSGQSAAAAARGRRLGSLGDVGAEEAASASSPWVSPNKLRSAYKASRYSGTPAATQAIFATIGQVFAPDDLELFQTRFGLPVSPIARVRGIHAGNASFCKAHHSRCDEASLDVQYVTAMAPGSPTTFWYESSFADPSPFVSWLVRASADKQPPLVHSVSYGQAEKDTWSALRAAFDAEAVKLSLRGVSILVASGDDGVSGSHMASSGKDVSQCGYYPHWPASSPWVTSVGATMGGAASDGSPEMACSSGSGSAITSGGGFSQVYAAPAWQRAASKAYFAAVSPPPQNAVTSVPDITQGFNPNNRGFPDLSLAGDGFLVVIGGALWVLSGTSASTPALAGIISLGNAARLAKGMPALGYLNPLIYSTAQKSFANDITKGANLCLRGGMACCRKAGFTAAVGWDPVTGFGSVDVDRFIKAVTSSSSPTPLPTAKSPTARPRTTAQPISKPTSRPSFQPSSQPSSKPSSQPSSQPSSAGLTADPASGSGSESKGMQRATGSEAAFGYAVALALGLGLLVWLFRRGPWWTAVPASASGEKITRPDDDDAILRDYFPEATTTENPLHRDQEDENPVDLDSDESG